jgi:hypothetical protein
MKWVLLLVAILLFLWTIRENFVNYADALADVGQTTGYTDTAHPNAPHTGVGTAGTASTSTASTSTSTDDKCKDEVANKQWSDVSQECKSKVSGQSSSTPSGTNTTGGSSLTPQTTMGDRKDNKVWGPAFVGLGDNSGLGGLYGPREYPALIGPKPKESAMVEGAGVIKQPNSSNKAGLPSSKNTGSDEDSKYFGSSRVPGDKDLFPNPYQEFTPSIGSSKTEPVPFLSDFSAFQK